MPYHVVLRDGKYRILDKAGKIATNKGGTAMDGGGHATQAAAEKQVRAVEWREHGGGK